jgi:hypothetical protein
MQIMEEGRKMKCEITADLFSWREHQARPSPYLKIYFVGATRELVAAGVAFLMHRENFTEKFSAVLGFLSLLTTPRDNSVDFRVFSLKQ